MKILLEKHIFFSSIFCFLLVIIGLLTWNTLNDLSTSTVEALIYLFSCAGTIVLIYILSSSTKINNQLFSIYSIFVIFIYMFNFGQFLMWSVGIHTTNELGLSYFVRYMDYITILKILILSVPAFLIMHIGYISVLYGMLKEKLATRVIKSTEYTAIKITSIVLLLLSAPIAYLYAFEVLQITLRYGYTSTYYGEYVVELSPLMKYASYFFFPALIALWLSLKKTKKAIGLVWAISIPYFAISIASGDRGNWIYFFVVLVWMSMTTIKRINLKWIFITTPIAFVLIIVISYFVSLRDSVGSQASIENLFVFGKNWIDIIIKPIFEMGQSARVLGIMIQDSINESWNYGNTHISAVLASVLPRVKTFFGFQDFYLENFFSQTYLGLTNYGVGFSLFAEGYLNYGPIGVLSSVYVYGFVAGLMHRLYKSNKPIFQFIALSSTVIIPPIARASLEIILRKWVYGVIITLLLYKFVHLVISRAKYTNSGCI